MASSDHGCSAFLPLLLISLSMLSMSHVCLGGRYLLEAADKTKTTPEKANPHDQPTFPTIPILPKPEFPTLPETKFPEIPKLTEGRYLPEMKFPEIPNPFDLLPGLPKLPEMPNVPMPTLPQLPEIPMPNLPFPDVHLPMPTLPQLPASGFPAFPKPTLPGFPAVP
ncbi:hypothetical protein EJ110_NYTH11559 [Nymphaea thermarum]|nr:hypothetical protein EJ110_NYTH11559 [Nymphaea thermarum]